jgi:hypothetical protein
VSLGEEPHPPAAVPATASVPATAPAAAPAPARAACENCGAVLAGPFCHACSQAAEPPTRSVRAFASQAAADLTNLDGRIPRTLGLLLARPGRLTREYLAGRRVRYTQPLQLYLGCAAAFFFVNAYRPFLTFNARTGAVVSSLSAAGASGAMSRESQAALAARGISLEVFRGRFEGAVTGYLPAFLIGSVLLFAVAVQLAFRRSRRGYLEHAVFALHWSAFFLLLMIVDRLIPQHAGGPGRVDRVVAGVAVVYLGLALKHVYGGSWLATGARTLLLFVVYQLLLSLWMLSAAGVAFQVLL